MAGTRNQCASCERHRPAHSIRRLLGHKGLLLSCHDQDRHLPAIARESELRQFPDKVQGRLRLDRPQVGQELFAIRLRDVIRLQEELGQPLVAEQM